MISKPKKILIIGDSARGKTTLTLQLHENLKFPVLHLDSVLWEKQLIATRPEAERFKIIDDFIKNNSQWIIEGATKHLIKPVISHADMIIYLKHKYFIVKLLYVIKRGIKEKQTCKQIWTLVWYLVNKQVKLVLNHSKSDFELILEPYLDKTVTASSWSDIQKITDLFER